LFRRHRQTKQFCKRSNYFSLMRWSNRTFPALPLSLASKPGRLFDPSLLETCNFHGQLRVVVPSQQRISVVGDGNFGVGKQFPPPKPGEPMAGNDSSSLRRTDTSNPQKTELPRVCGAMTQQCGDSGRGNDQTPQKFVHLVGCRDPNARPATRVRPGPAPVKQ
jgi:hypothetical protein